MATQPTSTETTPEPQDAGEAPSVIDNTPAEVLAQEAAFEAGTDTSQPEPAQPDDGAQEVVDDGAGTDEVTPEPQVAVTQPAEQPEAQAPETPVVEDLTAPKHSEESMRQAQSKWQGEIAEANRRTEEAQRRVDEFDISAQVEAYLQSDIQQASTTMGAEEADRFVRNPVRVTQIRQGFEAKKETERLKQDRIVEVQQTELADKARTAFGFQQQHGLSQEDAILLMGMNDPYKMQAMAERLGNANRTAAVQGTVPAETPGQVPVGNGTSTTQSPPNQQARATTLRGMDVMQMDDDTYEEWKRQTH